ncbi:MAG: glycosyl transferase [Oligoflexia bacterium]|nr:MAG: glycosyl transferase [Oligoflexia bacterium]
MAFAAKKVSIVIPVFNESKTVEQLLNAVSKQSLPGDLSKELVIVESNSTDGTRQLVQKFVTNFSSSEKTSVKLILQDKPSGKGYAVREGLASITGDIVLIQDGDLEYDVADYPLLIQPILDGHADFVLGSRHLSAGSWKIRKFNNTTKATILNVGGVLFHVFFNITYGVKLTDPTTMYKVFRSECIKGVLFHAKRFDFDFELVAKLIRLGYIPLEVPISYTSRGFEEGKKINILRDPFLWIYSILKYRFTRIERVPSAQRKNQLIAHH